MTLLFYNDVQIFISDVLKVQVRFVDRNANTTTISNSGRTDARANTTQHNDCLQRSRRHARFSKYKIIKTSPATDQDTSGRREEEALERQEQAEHFMDERAAEGPQLGRELDHDGEESAASTRL